MWFEIVVNHNPITVVITCPDKQYCIPEKELQTNTLPFNLNTVFRCRDYYLFADERIGRDPNVFLAILADESNRPFGRQNTIITAIKMIHFKNLYILHF